MGHHRTPARPDTSSPLSSDEWEDVVASLRLPPRQADIVRLILQGKQDKEIAMALGLRRSTIRTYLARIFARLGVSDRVQLILCVCSNHLKSKRQPECHPEG